MKPGSKAQICVLAGLAALAIAFAACSRDQKPPPPPTPVAQAPTEEDSFRKVHILTAQGEVVVTLRWDGEEVQVFFEQDGKRRFLRSRLGKGRQRGWNERGVGPVALVRTNTNGNAFSLRSPGGDDLWWRVRYGERVTLARDNPEVPGFDLRQAVDKGVKVSREDKTELGQVTVNRKTSQVQVYDAEGNAVFKTAKNAPASKLYGVLLVPELEPTVRYILMAELLVR